MHKRDQYGIIHVLAVLLIAVLLAVPGVIIYRAIQKRQTPAPVTVNQFDPEWEKRIDTAMAEVDCPAIPKASWREGYYKGPLIDAHFHIPSLPDAPLDEHIEMEGNGDTNTPPVLGINSTMSRIACTLKREGTKKVLAWFAVFPEIDQPSVELVRRAMEKYPDTFVPFIMPPDDDGSPDGSPTVDANKLNKMLGYEPGLFKGYGEIGLYARNGGAKALAPDSSRLQAIYPVLRTNNVKLVYFHLGEGQQASFEKTLKANRDINFLFHGDQLITYGEEGRQDLTRIDEILSRHPNAYYGIDELYGDDFILKPEVGKKAFLAHFNNYEPLLAEDLATWKDFIERHPSQVMWDTDRGWSSPWSMEIEAGLQLTDYARAFIGRLDPAVQKKYAYQNVERLVAGR